MRIGLVAAALACAGAARADMSYTVTGNAGVERRYVKGARFATESGDVTTVFDCEAKTVTVVDRGRRTYTVRGFGEIGAGRAVAVQAKEAGEGKVAGGMKARRLLVTGAAAGAEFETDIEAWVTEEVAGAAEWRAFWARWGDVFPWAALGAEGAIERAVWKAGVPVREAARKRALGTAEPTEAQKKQLEQAMAKLREMASAGGAEGAAAQDGLRQLAARGVQEDVREAGGFSGAEVEDKVMRVPEGFGRGQ